MKIKKIIAKNKKSTYLLIFNDGETMEIPMDLAFKYNISSGMNLVPETYQKLSQEKRIYDAKNSVYSFVSYKPRTFNQIAGQLKRKGFLPEEINIAMEFAGEFNLYNDEKFATLFILDYLKRKTASKQKLIMELRNKGITKEIAEKAVTEHYPADSAFDIVRRSAEKKLSKVKYKPAKKQIELLRTHLIREGYSYNLIKQVMSEMKIEEY
ncbi:MAG: hypothetical protein HW421_1306 [Ignavibacteria bacterium]|nr:hypothetical protein [Ignavibacteria bacterium]